MVSSVMVLTQSHNPLSAITLREAALSYRTLPKRNDGDVFEKKPIEGLVFLKLSYLSALQLNKHCTPISMYFLPSQSAQVFGL